MEKFREIVIDQLKFANQRRLIDMIIKLLQNIQEYSLGSIVLGDYTVEELAKAIKEARNELVHRGKKGRTKEEQDILFDLAPRMQYLIGINLLLDMGFTQDHFKRWFE
jgi:hypothetical protein